MSVDRELIRRFLRQRAELGESSVFLETLTARDAVRALRGGPALPSFAMADPAMAAGQAAIGAGSQSARPKGPVGVERRAVAGSDGGVRPAWAAASSRRASEEDGKALRVLQSEAEGCTACRLHEGRRNVVFGVGNPAAELVVVGEAPGQQEDLQGYPFVGPAGKLLDKLLLSIGFERDDVYICNVLKCRPPNNRNPMPDEVETCSPYLHGQLERIRPLALLAVGKFAAQTLLDTEESIGRLRGRIHNYRGVPLVATYHPAFLLRSRQWTRATWQDFQLVREVLEQAG